MDRSEARRVGKECRYWRDWSSDVCSSDLVQQSGREPASAEPQDLDAPRASQDATAAALVVGKLPRLAAVENIDWPGAHLERGSLPAIDLSGAYLGWTDRKRVV